MKRNHVSVIIALLFIILALTGVMGFFFPFNIQVVSVHSLLGFLFIGALLLHLKNNWRLLKGYFLSRAALVIMLLIVGLTLFIVWQPSPIKEVLGLSGNLGPAMERFTLKGDMITYQYTPASHYKMVLQFKGGRCFSPQDPPAMAIWLENTSRYHLKTLYSPSNGSAAASLPYWSYKKAEYEKHKALQEAYEETGESLEGEVDALSSATPNDSFNPADYVVPTDPERESPFRLLLEINLPGDKNAFYADQPSLIYAVEVDNRNPRTYQVLDLVGYPQAEEGEEGEEWSLRYVDESITTAHDLYDSALLIIERAAASSQ